jgi:hypothetical protein
MAIVVCTAIHSLFSRCECHLPVLPLWYSQNQDTWKKMSAMTCVLQIKHTKASGSAFLQKYQVDAPSWKCPFPPNLFCTAIPGFETNVTVRTPSAPTWFGPYDFFILTKFVILKHLEIFWGSDSSTGRTFGHDFQQCVWTRCACSRNSDTFNVHMRQRFDLRVGPRSSVLAYSKHQRNSRSYEYFTLISFLIIFL